MQSKISKGIIFFTFLLLMFLHTNANTAFAADITIDSTTYNEYDYVKLKSFLNQNSIDPGKTNGKMMNTAYDENNPTTWSGVTWTDDAVKRVKSISWSKKKLAGELDISGAAELSSLACDGNSLTALNVSGNTKLTSIHCNSNKLSTLDLSANTALMHLYCYSNKLVELNISACASLNELYCYSNLLTSIDVSSCTLLNKLACESNKLTVLDVSNNTALTYLACYSNKLSMLNVSSNTNLLALHCYTNEIADLDLSNNIKLTTLSCNNNPLGELDVSFNTKLTTLRCDLNKLTELDVSNNIELTFLQCDTNILTTLDVSKNTKLNDLRCYSNQLTELELEKNTVLTKLVCDNNKLTELDVSKNVMLSYLACYSNQLSSLNLGVNTGLVYLYCQENQLSQLGVSANIVLKELFCYGNQLTAIDVSANAKLANLRCYSNQLSELEVDKNVALTQLTCQSNQLTELNVSNNKLLTSLDCSSNQLAELNVINNTGLTTIHCQFNDLISLDVSSNELLTELWCNSNKLTSLNTSENTNLKTVWCYANKLTALDLSKSKGLDYLKCNDNYLEEINADVSNKSINISANGNGYVELSRSSGLQFYVVAVPKTGSLFNCWTQAGANVSENLLYNLVAGTSYELKANFSQNIEFDSQGGSAIANQIVGYGNVITEPAEPTQAGYDFKGWYKEAECINVWDFSTDVVPGDITLYAKWTDKTYSVAYDGNTNTGGTVPTDGNTYNITDTVTVLGNSGSLEKTGYTFEGWNTQADGAGADYYPGDSFPINTNTTLYAKWTGKTIVSIVQTAQNYIYDGTAKTFAITGTPDTGFTVTYNQGTDNLSPLNPGSYNVEITRDEDATYAAFRVTIRNGLVIKPAAVDIATISGVTAPVRGVAPVTTITETAQYTGAVTWVPTVTGSFAASTEYTATITLTPKTGYTLTGVTADFFTVTGATSDNNDVDSGVITAVFHATGAAPSGGGGGSPATTPSDTYYADVKAGDDSASALPVTVERDNGTATIDVGYEDFNQSGTKITIPSIPEVDTYTVGMPVTVLSTAAEQGSLILDTDAGSVTVPSNMLTGVEGASGSKAEISIGHGDKLTLPDNVKSAIGDRPLVQLTLSVDDKQTDWANPSAPVTVSIPYTPSEAEQANPESIVVWYIDGSGSIVTIPNGRYDAVTGTVTFSITHFSDFAVAYNKVSFNDVASDAWYNKAVSFIAAREITSGTGNGNYSPEAKLTRGDFIVLMMRAYGIEADANPADNFSDAGNTYYTGYLAAAKRLGITVGIGDNMYAPGNQITRQEMFTLLYNALKVIGQLPQGDSGKMIADFTDSTQISAWAQDAMTLLVETGTVEGSNGKLNPNGTTTRAEMAQVLFNLFGK